MEEVKALLPNLLGSLEEINGRVVTEGIIAIQNLLKFMQRNDIVTLAEKLLPLFSNVSVEPSGEGGAYSLPNPRTLSLAPPSLRFPLCPCFCF